jgi:Undecaprenyl-phosphate galactose phosphotransferase WbaP
LVKGQIEAEVSESATALIGTHVPRGGVSHSRVCYGTLDDDAQNASMEQRAEGNKASTRRVGPHYLFQLLLNSLPLLLVDILTLTATIIGCRLLWGQFDTTRIDVSAFLIPITTGFVLLNIELGLYPGVRLSPVEEMRRLVVSVSCMFIVWAIAVQVLRDGLADQALFLVLGFAACVVTLPVCRSWARRFMGRWLGWGIPVLVCGDDPGAVRLHHWLRNHHHLGLRPVGVIGDPDAIGIGPEDDWYAGPWSAAHEIACQRGVYWAVVVPADGYSNTVANTIAEHLGSMPFIHVLSEPAGLPDHWSPHRELDGLTGVHLQQNLMLPLPRLTKRLMDLSAALVGGALLLPLLFYIAVAVKLSSRGPIIYGHERIGRGGRRFRAWKFRTMFENAGDVLEYYLEQHPELREEWEQDHKLRYDPRVTRIGRFIRKTSLDELPQLWNVIRGQMSLVGPRPIVNAEVEKYGPYFRLYTVVKPGITGLWQVSGRNNTTYEERVQLDAYYVRNWSPWLDVYLLLKTVRIVLFAKGAY